MELSRLGGMPLSFLKNDYVLYTVMYGVKILI